MLTVKRSFILLFALAAALTASAAYAQPPSNVSAVWNRDSATLTVTANHPVKDPAKHFVMLLTVKNGDKQIFSKKYTQQQSAETFKDTVPLTGVIQGDRITVQLVCNIMGETQTTAVIQ